MNNNMNNNIHKDHDQPNNKLTLNKQNKNTFTVFHQTIYGLLNKKEELLNSIVKQSPQIISITEHHLNDEELGGITLHSYIHGAKLCRWTHKCGSVCIFIQNNIYYTTTDMDRYSNEKDIEICAIKLHISLHTIIIVSVYRSQVGDIVYTGQQNLIFFCPTNFNR